MRNSTTSTVDVVTLTLCCRMLARKRDRNRYIHVHVLMRDEKEGGKQQGQTNNKVKQHSTPKAVTFPKKNELLRYIYTYTLYILDFSQHDANIHNTLNSMTSL